MKITAIETMRLNAPTRAATTPARRPGWAQQAEVANPMSRYPKVKRHRSLWLPKWEGVWCKVTAEDGTFGLGQTTNGRVTAAIIEDHLGPQLVGEDCLASEKLSDMLFRLTKPYGSVGLAAYAVSAIDLALWDLRGKLLGQPVYQLLGGPQKERLFCYATGNDVDWYQELGFRAFKLACPYGPADGLEGLRKNEEFVAGVRQQIGDDCELMLDCWMAFDVEYTVRLPWQTLTTGEHWYTHVPFQWAINHRVIDILQPDINWCGGLSTCQRIAGAADAAGVSVMLHGGGNGPYGQHFSFATPSVPWLECFIGTPPGVPLEETWGLPGQAVPKDGWLVPNDAPGFGLELPEDWFAPFFGR